MKYALSLALLICGVTLQAAPEGPVYHAVVTSTLTYMDATRIKFSILSRT